MQLTLFPTPERQPILYPGHEWQCSEDEAKYRVTYWHQRDTFYRPTVGYYRTFRGAWANVSANRMFWEQYKWVGVERVNG